MIWFIYSGINIVCYFINGCVGFVFCFFNGFGGNVVWIMWFFLWFFGINCFFFYILFFVDFFRCWCVFFNVYLFIIGIIVWYVVDIFIKWGWYLLYVLNVILKFMSVIVVICINFFKWGFCSFDIMFCFGNCC